MPVDPFAGVGGIGDIDESCVARERGDTLKLLHDRISDLDRLCRPLLDRRTSVDEELPSLLPTTSWGGQPAARNSIGVAPKSASTPVTPG